MGRVKLKREKAAAYTHPRKGGGVGEWRQRELERKFERNMATHVSKQPQTSALCKNNLSNYEKHLPAFST